MRFSEAVREMYPPEALAHMILSGADPVLTAAYSVARVEPCGRHQDRTLYALTGEALLCYSLSFTAADENRVEAVQAALCNYPLPSLSFVDKEEHVRFFHHGATRLSESRVKLILHFRSGSDWRVLDLPLPGPGQVQQYERFCTALLNLPQSLSG